MSFSVVRGDSPSKTIQEVENTLFQSCEKEDKLAVRKWDYYSIGLGIDYIDKIKNVVCNIFIFLGNLLQLYVVFNWDAKVKKAVEKEDKPQLEQKALPLDEENGEEIKTFDEIKIDPLEESPQEKQVHEEKDIQKATEELSQSVFDLMQESEKITEEDSLQEETVDDSSFMLKRQEKLLDDMKTLDELFGKEEPAESSSLLSSLKKGLSYALGVSKGAAEVAIPAIAYEIVANRVVPFAVSLSQDSLGSASSLFLLALGLWKMKQDVDSTFLKQSYPEKLAKTISGLTNGVFLGYQLFSSGLEKGSLTYILSKAYSSPTVSKVKETCSAALDGVSSWFLQSKTEKENQELQKRYTSIQAPTRLAAFCYFMGLPSVLISAVISGLAFHYLKNSLDSAEKVAAEETDSRIFSSGEEQQLFLNAMQKILSDPQFQKENKALIQEYVQLCELQIQGEVIIGKLMDDESFDSAMAQELGKLYFKVKENFSNMFVKK